MAGACFSRPLRKEAWLPKSKNAKTITRATMPIQKQYFWIREYHFMPMAM
jgi:hypothetical protein